MKLTPSSIKAMTERFSSLKSRRGNWESYWSSLAAYVIPAEDEIYTFLNRTHGAEKNLRMYDSSAAHYNELLASALHSMLTNPATNWFELTTGDRKLDADDDVKDHLQEVSDIIHNSINNSNFHTEAHTYYLGLGSFGTSFMHIMEDDEDDVRFKTRQIFGAYVDSNHKGFIDTAYIPYKMSHRNMLAKFGEDAFTTDQARRLNKEPNEKTTILMVITPRGDIDIAKKDAKNMAFAGYYIWESEDHLMKETGFREQPFVCSRWALATDEDYGRSPAMKTLPDNRMIQQIMKTTIRGAQKIVDPPLLVPDDSVMSPNTTPGGLNSFRAGTEDFIRPLQTGGQPGLGLEIMTDIRSRIKQGFFIDQLQLPEGPQKTATEVNAILQEQLRLFGPVLGRQENEFLKVLINRVLGILKRKGKLPTEIPEALQGKNLSVRFSSQIAKAQRLAEAQSVDAFLGGIANVAQFKPQVLDYIDEAGYVEFSASAHNVPSSILRKKKEVEAIQKAQAEQGEKQQALQEGQQEVDIAATAAKTA